MLLDACAQVFTPVCLGLITLGVVIGIIFGAIPGLSSTMAVVLFLPMSFGMSPVNGLSLLIGLYLGGISGGLISAILLKIPGTPSSIATVFDGGPMAAHGEAGKALGAGILYSFIGGLISIFALIFVSPYLAAVTIKFTPVEYFSVAIFSLTIIASLSGKSLLKGLLAGLFGIAISMVGMAPIDSLERFTFGNFQLMNGFDIVVILIGLFAVTDIILSGYNRKHLDDNYEKARYEIKGFGVTMQEFKDQFVNMIRSALIGIGIGILPGIGGNVAGLLSYTAAQNASDHPEKFGTGIVDGVIPSETSNNAVIGGSLIPLITMGIPGNTVSAILLEVPGTGAAVVTAFDGHSLPQECERGVVNTDRVWWVQAEAVNGFLNGYEKENNEEYLKAAGAEFNYIMAYMIDSRKGSEWFWLLDKDNKPYETKPIVEPWKCPYHNGRMLFRILEDKNL